MPPTVELARRDGVELVRTGSWPLMTGTWEPTSDDINHAIEALKCPAVGRPVLKIGHLDDRFTPRNVKASDGEPSIGWVDNLRAEENGDLLVGDFVGVPAWINDIMASAWSRRSIEGDKNFRCTLGHTHPFALHAVSLLGVTRPGIGTLKSLQDVADLYGVQVAAAGEENGERVSVMIQAAAEVHTGAMVALIPTDEDAARLAVDGGEPPEQLHVTLAYLGEAVDLGAAGQQDVIDAVSSAANGLPVIEAEAFSPALFNPGNANDRDPCAVLVLSGEWLDIVHTLVTGALYDVPIPDQHRPWIPHLTTKYADGTETLKALAAKVGPIRFDRLRIAFAGQALDIPLIGDVEPADPVDDSEMVAAASADRKSLKAWWLHGPGLKKWESWTDLYKHLRTKVDPSFAKRIAAEWFHERYGYWPGDKRNRDKVAAAEGLPTTEPHTPTPPDPGGVSVSPAAEPDLPPEEDLVSLDPDVRQRLGLADDADKQAMLAAIDELKTKAEAPAEPTAEMVAASAAVEKATAAQAVMKDEITRLSGELATIKASAAATVKASFFEGLLSAGKLKPADRETWEQRYDRDPDMVTDILGTRAENSEVPVMASGHTGPAEPDLGDLDADYEKLVASIDGPTGKAA